MGQEIPERLYSAYQLAELLGVLPSEVTAWLQRGHLPFEQCSDGSARITEQALVAFLKQRGFDPSFLLTRPGLGGGSGLAELNAHRPIQVRALGQAGPAQPQETNRADGNEEVIDAEVRTAEPAGALPDSDASSGDAPAEPPMPIDLPATQIIDAILQEAVRRQACAVMLEQARHGLELRLRIGQELHPKPHFAQRLPEAMQLRLLERLGQLAGMQDGQRQGRFVRRVGSRRLEVGVSLLSGPTGRQVVLELQMGQ